MDLVYLGLLALLLVSAIAFTELCDRVGRIRE